MPRNEKNNQGIPLLNASILSILLFQTCALFAQSFAVVKLQDGGMPQSFAKDLGWLLVPLILGFLMFPVLRENWRTLKLQFRFRQLTMRLILVSVALGLTLRLAHWGGLIANASFHVFTAMTPESIIGPLFGFDCPDSGSIALAVLATVVLTPLLEETINRGFILQTLLPIGRLIAIAASAILFGIFMHRVPYRLQPSGGSFSHCSM